MKISITEQFLWDIYEIYNDIKNVSKLLLRPYPKMSRHMTEQNPVFKRYSKEMGKRRFSRFVSSLKARGYIKSVNLKNVSGVLLTKEGIDKAFKASFKQEKKHRKDGKWTMIIFDVPEKTRGKRDLLRSVLNNLGYKKLQQSAWVSPYDVSEQTEKYLQFYNLDEFVKIFLIEKID